MPSYLLQVGYTPEAWATLIKNPHDRLEAVRPAIEKLGGRIEAGWYAFGDYDVVTIVEMPDNVSAAAFSLAASAGGAVRTIKTTPLLSTAEAVAAMKKAGTTAYKPPKRKG
ncbi:MAG: GYD domain-containing protein [Acidobacteria bacterium]|nr:GYD domain-containing protein [Acidobacteriota bacterium]MBI3469872.1 GYD domain-containing protein [Candidatus Solibacter usitatus]